MLIIVDAMAGIDGGKMNNKCFLCGVEIPEGRIICPNCERGNRMVETIVKLNTTQDVVDFVNLCTKCQEDVLVYSGRYIVSGKSLLAMYSLNLLNTVKVEFHGDIPSGVRECMKKFIVN